jgi:DNA-binding transcriptional MerR regulator
MRYEEFVKKFAERFLEEAIIEPEEFPDVPLYADQASKFISEKLKIYNKDPLLTKTMIGNYVKHKLLPPPENRKYDRNQLVMMELILCLKTTFRMEDIEAIMKPFTSGKGRELSEEMDFYKLYKDLVPDYRAQRKQVADDIVSDMESIKERLRDLDAEDDDATEIFLLLMSIAMKVDCAMFIGKALLRTYYETRKPQERRASSK